MCGIISRVPINVLYYFDAYYWKNPDKIFAKALQNLFEEFFAHYQREGVLSASLCNS